MKRPELPNESHFPADGDGGSVGRMAAIARFQNAAEAGYFALELKLHQNIPVTVKAEEDFDAVSGRWSTGFVLSVPRRFAEKAALTLSELVRQTESDDDLPAIPASVEREPLHADPGEPFDPLTRDDDFAYPNTINWVPIVVSLAAGSLVIWGVKKLWEPARPQAAAPAKAHKDQLWEVMKTPQGRKWVQQDSAGRRIRELEIDPDGSEAVLREDNDGDEIFERTQRVKRP